MPAWPCPGPDPAVYVGSTMVNVQDQFNLKYIENGNEYDNWDRANRPKVFVAEYAVNNYEFPVK